jgi:hypothetical protein
MESDGHYLPEIRPHSLEKIRRHDYYAALFSKAMAKKWPRRAYIGLYAGAGRARLKDTGEIVAPVRGALRVRVGGAAAEARAGGCGEVRRRASMSGFHLSHRAMGGRSAIR